MCVTYELGSAPVLNVLILYYLCVRNANLALCVRVSSSKYSFGECRHTRTHVSISMI